MFDEDGFANSRGMPMAELSGAWTYRSLDPNYVTRGQIPEKLDKLTLAGDGIVLTLRPAADPVALEGTLEWEGGGLNLEGRVDGASFYIVGTGRRNTGTDGWEYRYRGHLARNWQGGGRSTSVPSWQRYPCRAPWR
jgi:hypothetical protein